MRGHNRKRRGNEEHHVREIQPVPDGVQAVRRDVCRARERGKERPPARHLAPDLREGVAQRGQDPEDEDREGEERHPCFPAPSSPNRLPREKEQGGRREEHLGVAQPRQSVSE